MDLAAAVAPLLYNNELIVLAFLARERLTPSDLIMLKHF